MITIMSAILYLLGGQVNKWFRWGMGLPIGLIMAYKLHSFVPLLCFVSYLIATNAFSYGEKMWTTKLFGAWISMAISGLMFGLASIFALGVTFCIVQGVIGLIAFTILKYLDDNDIVKNPYQELLRGLLGTIVYLIK